jgi:hypothetical protein
MEAGDVLRGGRYEIQRLLRSAPDKEVYLAHDSVLDRPVVVDVFSSNSVMPNGMTDCERVGSASPGQAR